MTPLRQTAVDWTISEQEPEFRPDSRYASELTPDEAREAFSPQALSVPPVPRHTDAAWERYEELYLDRYFEELGRDMDETLERLAGTEYRRDAA